MNKIYTIILLVTCFKSFGQNYNCFQPGMKNFFVNSDHYLRGIRIDSVITASGNTIYYPFHTTRYFDAAIDSNSGSWLGKQVMSLSDGSFIFDTYWGNPVTIKTQAMPGDVWTFYHDTSSKHYEATLVSTDTMTVLGSADSVKLIHITAYNGSTVNTADPANGFEIILSKDHGFVQVFDLYTFPYHPDTDDRYTACGHQIFKLTSFSTPTQNSIYDFSVGDVFEYYTSEQTVAFVEYQTTSIDSVISKVVDGSGVHYTIAQRSHIFVVGTGGLTGAYNEKGTYEMTVTSAPVIADTLMPEEKGFPYLVYYTKDDDSLSCITSPKYRYQLYFPQPFEDCGFGKEYKSGLGEIKSDSCLTELHNMKDMQLVYARKNDIGCGGYRPLTVQDPLSAGSHIAISPNPATYVINIAYPENITSLAICNIWGKQVLTQKCGTKAAAVNIEQLPAGIYFVSINGEAVSKFTKQ